ncbi:MAG: hypothetical protein DRJ51_04340 [Thermoprotei archaeon]|nr:MAG: hypothetical protein DRJ51_04340 [Thermoprotei archaeon]
MATPFRLIDKGIFEYAEKFWKLDATDFTILKAMSIYGPRNVSLIAARLSIPRTVVDYRVKRMFEEDLVKVFAIIDEEALGLESVLVYAKTPFGKEDKALKALTVHPLWRFSCLVEGALHGVIVRYAIPKGSIGELNAYLSYLKLEKLIEDYELHRAEQYYAPFPNLDFYLKETGAFKWSEWADRIIAEKEAVSLEKKPVKEIEFSWLDLYILSRLSIDARIKFTDIARKLVELKGGSLNSWKVKISQTYNKTTSRLIRGYSFYILPVAEQTSIRLLIEIHFNDKPSLAKFVNHLKEIPYPLALHPYKQESKSLLHIIIPTYELTSIIEALKKLAYQNLVKSYRVFLVNKDKVWSNVTIHQAYNKEWKFSHKILLEKLGKL